MTTPGDAEQSTKRQRPEDIPRDSHPASSSSCAEVLDPQIPKPARSLSPDEREDIPKGQRPAEVSTVSTIAGVYSGNEIATLTDDQKAFQKAKLKELLSMDKFGVVEVVDRPQSQQVLLTRWVSKQRQDGSYKVRLVARGFEQTLSSDTDFYAGTPKLTTLRALLTIAAIHEIQLLSECVTVRFTNHRCQPNQSRCMWNQHRKHSWTLPRYGFARRRFKD